VVIVAVYVVLLARLLAGVKTAVTPAYVTAPGTGVAPGPVTVNVAEEIVAGSIASLKIAEIFWLSGKPVAVFVGIVESTVGSEASVAALVVKIHTLLLANEVPAAFLAPVVIVAVNIVPAERLLVGVNTAVVPT